jgi:hypothetical protein
MMMKRMTQVLDVDNLDFDHLIKRFVEYDSLKKDLRILRMRILIIHIDDLIKRHNVDEMSKLMNEEM